MSITRKELIHALKHVTMPAETKRKWVEALRSGRYRQGRFALRRHRDGEMTYCCLGVLADVTGCVWVDAEDDEHRFGIKVDDYSVETEYLPLQMANDLFGVDAVEEDVQALLAGTNDSQVMFEEIANLIEDHVPES